MRKFDTCFFERYVQITLETVLGESYSALVNEDRPDLQMPDHSLGIEVTRAMEPRKEAAMTMEYTSELQRHLDVRYSEMYLSLIDKLYVCDLSAVYRTDHHTTLACYDISRAMCKEFFVKARCNVFAL